MPTMLILRGNSGAYENELGEVDKTYLKTGALHERWALEYARRKGYTGLVATASGDSDSKDFSRLHSTQTKEALSRFREEKSDIKAFYGFSGGGFNVYAIIQQLDEKERGRIDLLTVLGLRYDDKKTKKSILKPKSDYEAKNYKGAHWDVDYYGENAPAHKKVDPDDKTQGHMYLPKYVLDHTPDPDWKL